VYLVDAVDAEPRRIRSVYDMRKSDH
jgi:hypothetical protein